MFSRRLPALILLLTVAAASANTFVVTNTNDGGDGSLRQAIASAEGSGGPTDVDVIQFNIPGSGVHTISVSSALPQIAQPLLIDGWSQPGFQHAPIIELRAGPGVT